MSSAARCPGENAMRRSWVNGSAARIVLPFHLPRQKRDHLPIPEQWQRRRVTHKPAASSGVPSRLPPQRIVTVQAPPTTTPARGFGVLAAAGRWNNAPLSPLLRFASAAAGDARPRPGAQRRAREAKQRNKRFNFGQEGSPPPRTSGGGPDRVACLSTAWHGTRLDGVRQRKRADDDALPRLLRARICLFFAPLSFARLFVCYSSSLPSSGTHHGGDVLKRGRCEQALLNSRFVRARQRTRRAHNGCAYFGPSSA